MDKRGKSIFIISVIVFILISLSLYFILALDVNTKTYDEVTKTVTIKDGVTEVATIQLNTPLVYNVIRGKDRLVAEFTIENFGDYNDVFNDMKFYDVFQRDDSGEPKNNFEKFDREFNYKYKTIIGQKEIPYYRQECVDLGENQTSCNQILDRIEYEDIIEWSNFDDKSILPRGKITIGIFTDVYVGDKIEWIPTLFGVEIDEWAIWQDSLSVDLAHYWNFNETSGTNVEDQRGGDISYRPQSNGTLNDLTTVIFDEGKIGYGLNFSEGWGVVKLDNENEFDVLLNTSSNITISVWINPKSLGYGSGIFCNGQNPVGDPSFFCIQGHQTNLIWFYMKGDSGELEVRTPTNSITNNAWTHVVFVLDSTHNSTNGIPGSNIRIYINNVSQSLTQGVNNFVGGISADALDFPWIGVGFLNATSYYSFNGSIDELGIWNRTLSALEVSNLYNEGNGLTYSHSQDTNPPNVTINTPLNQSYSTNSITFNVTALDETAIDTCWYTLNFGVTNNSMSGSGNDYAHTNFSMTFGSHTVTFYCNDTSSNLNNSETQTFFINTPPIIPVQLLPENASGFEMYSTVTFVWENSTDADSDTITYDLEIYNKSDMSAENLIHSNTSITEGTTNTSINIKLSDYTTVDDDYYWHIRAYDQKNYSSWSPIRTFQYANWTITFNLTNSYTGEQIDTTGPQVNFDIVCDNGFNVLDVDNPYTATDAFAPGIWECIFSDLEGYYSGVQNISANNDFKINIPLSPLGTLTTEEHTWLEAIYNCIILEDCSLYNLLLEINQTIGNVWEHTKPTDESVVTSEIITNKVVNSTNNLTIDYTVAIPVKAGYSMGAYLPVRIGFWFLNTTNTTCYNQGDKPTGVEEPYCQPLIIETIGPMGGEVNFTVELGPSLPEGDYSIKRIIDIDPNNVWINYGQDVIGTFVMAEILSNYGASVENTGEVMPEKTISKITGAVIGAGQHLLSGWQLVVTIAIIGLILIVFIVSKTFLRLR